MRAYQHPYPQIKQQRYIEAHSDSAALLICMQASASPFHAVTELEYCCTIRGSCWFRGSRTPPDACFCQKKKAWTRKYLGDWKHLTPRRSERPASDRFGLARLGRMLGASGSDRSSANWIGYPALLSLLPTVTPLSKSNTLFSGRPFLLVCVHAYTIMWFGDLTFVHRNSGGLFIVVSEYHHWYDVWSCPDRCSGRHGTTMKVKNQGQGLVNVCFSVQFF